MKTRTRFSTIPLEGKPESAQADSKAGRIYVNMEDLNSVKVIDTATHIATHRLFLGCDNTLTVMMDSTNGKVVYSVPVAHEDSAAVLKIVQTIKTVRGARTMALDPMTHTIYTASSSCVLS